MDFFEDYARPLSETVSDTVLSKAEYTTALLLSYLPENKVCISNFSISFRYFLN